MLAHARVLIAVTAAAVLALPARTIGAQTPAGSAAALTPVIVRSTVDTVAAQVERLYAEPDTGRMIAARLRESGRAGAYDTTADPRRLAELLTTDLRSINHDLHLSVTYAPPGGGPPPLVAFADRSQHYALGRLDVLPGNVGYLELTGFSLDPGAQDMIVDALRYLATTSAIVIDVRRNRGGSGALSNFLISHFVGPDSVASLVVRGRNAGQRTTRYTLASVPGPRRPDVPLYVLTSRGTGSAGEDFAFVLKNLRRATIVGSRTAGAGHNVGRVSSGNGFSTGISLTRVSDPRTGLEWEQVGVQPDVDVDVSIALDVAHRLALEGSIASSSGATRQQLELHRETVAARLALRRVGAAVLASYAGEYEGGRIVATDGQALTYASRAGSMPEAAVALSDSTFALGSLTTRLMFTRDERGRPGVRLVQADGGALFYPRVTPRGP